MRVILVICIALISTLEVKAQTYSNPILPGFHPDPSICRVGEYYYLANSTFEFFPSVPIHRSKDLVNWELIGHVVTRNNQLNMEGYNASGGVHAPTIRYHNSKFYVVFTNIGETIQNLLFVADSAMTRWSDPYVITDERPWGIDPDLFFDDDGRCYFSANRKSQGEEPYPKYREIVTQELDLNTMQLVGELSVLSSGNVKGATSTEGPHIYKKDGLYYLIVAEGGTGDNHAVTIASSTNVFGPYEPCPYNPILTHRFMQRSIDLRKLGHADLVQTPEGDWWMVFLGVRYTTDQKPFMGRETYLVPVEWDGKYPVVNPGYGKVQFNYPLPPRVDSYDRKELFVDEFEDSQLHPSWTFLRSENDFAEVDNGALEISFQEADLESLSSPSFIGRRIESPSFEAIIDLEPIKLKPNETAGVTLLADNNNHVRIDLDGQSLKLIEVRNGESKLLEEATVDHSGLKIRVSSGDEVFSLSYARDNGAWVNFKENIRLLSLNKYRYTGAFIGFYGSSNGSKPKGKLQVLRFEYRNL